MERLHRDAGPGPTHWDPGRARGPCGLRLQLNRPEAYCACSGRSRSLFHPPDLRLLDSQLGATGVEAVHHLAAIDERNA